MAEPNTPNPDENDPKKESDGKPDEVKNEDAALEPSDNGKSEEPASEKVSAENASPADKTGAEESAKKAGETDPAAESIKRAEDIKDLPPPKTDSAITKTPAAAKAKAVTATKAPTRPAARKGPAKKGQDRRYFMFSWFSIAWVAFTATMVGWVLGTVRFLFPNVLSEPPSNFKAGYVNGYEEGIVTDRFKEQGSWVVRSRAGDPQGRDVIYALSTTCTHLGCTPNWLESEKKFKCPCHGSGFKISGINFEGPAPRPLERYAVTRSDDGQVLVDKSKKFQQERGEWDDPASYILL